MAPRTVQPKVQLQSPARSAVAVVQAPPALSKSTATSTPATECDPVLRTGTAASDAPQAVALLPVLKKAS